MSSGTLSKIDGRYEIRGEPLGRGGMGEVYLAYDPRLRRQVALKLMTTEMASIKEARDRFLGEPILLAQIPPHPNIAAVYDTGEDRDTGQPYIVMQYVDGRGLDKIIRAHKANQLPISIVEKLDYIIQVCHGLQHAHQHGIIHRDIKPANVLVQADGNVKLVDFGIGKATGAESLSMTSTGMAMGTPFYMSPEQSLAKRDIDGRADIFSSGVMLFELLTGEVPWDGEDYSEIAMKIRRDPLPSLSKYIQSYPKPLERVLEKALAKNKSDRYPNADEFALDLSNIQHPLRQEMGRQYFIDAKVSYDSGDLHRAKELLEQNIRIDPKNTEARELYNRLQRTVEQKQLTLRAAADEAIGQRRYTTALKYVDEFLQLNPKSTEMQRYRGQVVEALGRSEEIRKHLELARKADELGDFDAAEDQVRRAGELDPTDTQVRQLWGELKKHRELRAMEEQVRSEIQRGEFADAQTVLRQMRSLDENWPGIAVLAAEVRDAIAREERKRELNRALSEIRAMLAAEDVAGALAVSEAAMQKFSDDPVLKRLYDQARQKKQLKDELAESAALLAERRFSEAVAKLQSLLHSFPGEADVQRGLQAARAGEAEQNVIARAQESMRTGDFEAAVHALKTALIEFPSSAEIRNLLRVAEERRDEEDNRRSQVKNAQSDAAAKADREITALMQRVRIQAEDGDFAGAITLLRQALQQRKDPRLEALLQQVSRQSENFQRFFDQFRSIVDHGDVDQALSYLNGQPPEYRRFGAVQAMVDRAVAEQQQLRAALQPVEQFAAKEEFTRARTALAEIEKKYGQRPEVRGAADALRQRETESCDRKVRAAIQKARELWQGGEAEQGKKALAEARKLLQSASAEVREAFERAQRDLEKPPVVAAAPPSATIFGAAVGAAPAPATQQMPVAAPAAAPPPPTPLWRKPAVMVAAAAPVVAVILYFALHTSTYDVRFEGTPAGTSVSVDGQQCNAPCTLKLKPGQYTANETANGYEAGKQQFTVTSQMTQTFILTPPPPPPPPAEKAGDLKVEVNVDGADLLVDGNFQARITGKSFTAKLAAGKHKIEVAKPGYSPAPAVNVSIEVGKTASAGPFTLKAVDTNDAGFLVVAGPPNASVMANGNRVGAITSGPLRVPIAKGRYRVEVTLEGHQPWSQDNVEIQPKGEKTLTAVMPAFKPSVDSFATRDATIDQGKSTELRWATKNAIDVDIQPAVGRQPANGSFGVSPDKTTTYKLTARNSEGATAEMSVTVTVTPVQVVAQKAAIRKFEAAPTQIKKGQPAGLVWTTEHATEVTLNGSPVDASGVSTVSPTATTNYILVAKGAAGSSDTKTVIVTVTADQAPPPPPAANPLKDAIERFRIAYEAMSTEEFQRVWPMNKAQKSALNDFFKTAKQLRVSYDCQYPEPSGDTAQVPCTEHIRYTNAQGQFQKADPAILFILKKGADGWHVEDHRGR